MTAALAFFDCNAVVGRWAAPVLGNLLEPDDLLAEMAYAGIAEALVSHISGKQRSPAEGNQAVLAATRGRPALHPSWTVVPRHGRLDPPEEEQVAQMLASGVRAARLHPNPTAEIMDENVYPRHFPLDEVAAGAALAALEAHRVPLFLELSQVRWEEIYAVCSRHPSLPLVLLNVSYVHKRSLFAGLYRFPNLRFEISGYHIHRGLEEVCREFGAERMLFGTRLPLYTAGSALAMVNYADVSEAEQRLIAGDNLRALLQQVRASEDASVTA